MSKKLRCYHGIKEVVDTKGVQHTILVYGELEQTNSENGFVIAPITYSKNGGNIFSVDGNYNIIGHADTRPTRRFNFGWAICCSDDKFDLSTGIKLAKKRFSDSPMTTTDVRFFSNDMIKAIIDNELNFITEHFEKFVPNTKIEAEDVEYEIECDDVEKEVKEEEQTKLEETNKKYNEYNKFRNNWHHTFNHYKHCKYNNQIREDLKNYNKNKEPQMVKTEEFPVVDTECILEHPYKNFETGDFIVFGKEGENWIHYGVVKSTGDGIKLYWELIKYREWSFGFVTSTESYKNLSIYTHVKRQDVEHSEDFKKASEYLKGIFGYKWLTEEQKLVLI